jgi:hypothetical protein
MRLDSARNLKAALVEELSPAIAMTPRGISAFGLPARRSAEIDRVQPTVALGVSPKGRARYELAVRVQHRGILGSDHLEAIRTRARGEIDVRYIGRVVKYGTPWYRARQRPLVIGSSVGHHSVTAGTLGCFVRVDQADSVYILSNNHVLADEDRGTRGDEIVQPGSYDGGKRPRDVVARLSNWVRLKQSGTNAVDCALARTEGAIERDDSLLRGAGNLSGVADPANVERVEKIGRTTGHTRGRVTAFELDHVVVGYEIGNLTFDNQLEVQATGSRPFSRGGDSGSIVFSTGDHNAVGLLFAGSDLGGRGDLGLRQSD